MLDLLIEHPFDCLLDFLQLEAFLKLLLDLLAEIFLHTLAQVEIIDLFKQT